MARGVPEMAKSVGKTRRKDIGFAQLLFDKDDELHSQYSWSKMIVMSYPRLPLTAYPRLFLYSFFGRPL